VLADARVALVSHLRDRRIVAERAACLANGDLLDAVEIDEARLGGVVSVMLPQRYPGLGAQERVVAEVDADEARLDADEVARVRLAHADASKDGNKPIFHFSIPPLSSSTATIGSQIAASVGRDQLQDRRVILTERRNSAEPAPESRCLY
jgi:hypothetical protein